jgi:uncharacterized membrane protein YccC
MRMFDLVPPLRLAVAALAAFAASAALGLPEGYWAALSAVIVARPLPGAATQAGTDRLVGTFVGGGVACGAALLRPWVESDLALLALALLPSALAMTWKDGWRTAPVAAVIVISAVPGAHGAAGAALLRVAEIALGAGFGVATAWLLLPASSERAAEGLAAKALGLLREVRAAAEAGEAEAARGHLARVGVLRLRLGRVIGGSKWERADRDALARLQAALARLSISTAYLARALAEAAPEAAADHARGLAHRDAAALAALLKSRRPDVPGA